MSMRLLQGVGAGGEIHMEASANLYFENMTKNGFHSLLPVAPAHIGKELITIYMSEIHC